MISWKGLNFCENLAADYPYVVDYYLHGGRERLRDAVTELSKLLQVDPSVRMHEDAAVARPREGSAALLEPGEIREHLQRLDRVLDTDPHFRYGWSLDWHRPDLPPEPRLVAATQEAISGGRWLTFKIYQRSAQSLDERPIPLELTFNFENSPPTAKPSRHGASTASHSRSQPPSRLTSQAVYKLEPTPAGSGCRGRGRGDRVPDPAPNPRPRGNRPGRTRIRHVLHDWAGPER